MKRNAKSVTSGFHLYQPWAVGVGEGRLPVLVRAQSIKKRGRVAIIANEGIDGKFLFALTDEELARAEKAFRFSCILGSVEIVDCVPCHPEDVMKRMTELAGERRSRFYPIYMLPASDPGMDLYLWVLKSPIKLRAPIAFKARSPGWVKITLTKAQQEQMTHEEKQPIPSFWEH
jgi:hypothetical protein